MESPATTTKKGLKRGRPKTATVLEEIMNNENLQDSVSSQDKRGYKCEHCPRYLPRRKSLKTHMMTHTGEKPYTCTYPGCEHVFTQSGHLKTHTKRHTGEKPFACPVPGCTTRYTHPNRNCHKHIDKKLRRDGLERICYPAHLTVEERLWLKDYEAKLAQSFKRPLSFKRQRNASASSRRDSFDLNVSTSSDMGRLVIDERDQTVPSVAKPCNFIWNKENVPSGSTTPQSLASGYSAASPESGSTTPRSFSTYYPSTPPESGSTSPQSFSTYYPSTPPESGSITPRSSSTYYPSTPPESGSTTPQSSSSASPGREYNSASDDDSLFNRFYSSSPLEREVIVALVNFKTENRCSR